MAASIASRGSNSFIPFNNHANMKIEIQLKGQVDGRVKAYTTGDQIEGVAKITATHETRFDEIEISLLGRSQTSVERAACPGRTGSQHTFLKLRQPIESTDYPTPRALESGHEYEFPFTFVVPERLLPQVCTHSKKHEHVHQAHTMLPPTLGDVMILEQGKNFVDDMAPDMSEIGYKIVVSVLQRRNSRSDSDESNLTMRALAKHAKKIRIIPITEEAPPLETEGQYNYCLRKEKNVKRGFLRATQGKLIASASQPKAIRLVAPNCEIRDRVSTVVKVQLRFEPVGNEQPPSLGSVSSKIKSNTFYSAEPWKDFPVQTEAAPFSNIGQALFSTNTSLSTMCVSAAQWERHTSSPEDRRESVSTISSDVSAGPSASFSGDVYYTSTLVIPITLPTKKKFVPTFHSCLMSRVYSIELNLSWHTPAANIITPSLSLRLPVQLMTESKTAAIKSSVDVVVTQEELEAFFQPRSTLTPEGPLPLIELAAPPGYSPRTLQSQPVVLEEPPLFPSNYVSSYQAMGITR